MSNNPTQFMLVAGEASGDKLAAELVLELRKRYAESSSAFAPRFFGAGGPEMAAAGVEIVEDMMAHSAVGLSEVVRKYATFRRIFHHLLKLAKDRLPDAIICVDFSGFNRRFGHAVRRFTKTHRGQFYGWNPKIIQYISPQVWASRPGRATAMAEDFDLLLSIIPFEREWYARHAPKMRVEFVGHPMIDRHAGTFPGNSPTRVDPLVVLLPGSRRDEIRRHLPVILGAAQILAAASKLRFRIVLPNQSLVDLARPLMRPGLHVEIVIGRLAESLAEASIAIASTGTVTMECALFGVPTVTLYRTSWPTYVIGRMIVKVDYLTMPNILRGGPVFPEFVQNAATPENIARAALNLLNNDAQRTVVKAELSEIIGSLGGPGAAARAAKAIFDLVGS